MIDAQTIHARLGADGWRRVLLACGATEQVLRKKPSQCPACGGKDRYTFNNKWGQGDFFCRQCGAGDGVKLLENSSAGHQAGVVEMVRIQGWEAEDQKPTPGIMREALAAEEVEKAQPTRRVLALLRESCAIEDCGPAMRYLESRVSGRFPSARDFALTLRSSTGTSTSG